MANNNEREKNFSKYANQEEGTISLKEFFQYDFDSAAHLSNDMEDIKSSWLMIFDKYIKNNNIQNFSKAQPDWYELLRKTVVAMKRSRETTIAAASSSSSGIELTSASSASSKTTTTTTKRVSILIEAPIVTLRSDTEKWVINEVNITKNFIEYREASVEKARNGTLVSIHEELSLNCIFLIDGINCESNACLIYGLDEDIWKEMITQCDAPYEIKDLSIDTTNCINQFAKAARKEFPKCKSIIKQLPDDLFGYNERIECSLRNLIDTHSPDASEKATKMESSFTLAAVDPLLLPFFKETDMITRKGTDSQITGSKTRRGKVGRFADLSMVFDFADIPNQTLVIVEIKPPVKVADGSRPDFIKLANEMKDSIDNYIKEGFDDDEIFVTGILIEGM
ncbi:hypothetical protein INT45_000874 [Circinella minor]|uniref:Uncharacterized protein n=1 Tax=Circinella minor TaxID=1195481 RepID=A0A8H7VQR0_9FUNG|nr:hypothetical protein INT45_000874 [Circinella minor]